MKRFLFDLSRSLYALAFSNITFFLFYQAYFNIKYHSWNILDYKLIEDEVLYISLIGMIAIILGSVLLLLSLMIVDKHNKNATKDIESKQEQPKDMKNEFIPLDSKSETIDSYNPDEIVNKLLNRKITIIFDNNQD